MSGIQRRNYRSQEKAIIPGDEASGDVTQGWLAAGHFSAVGQLEMGVQTDSHRRVPLHLREGAFPIRLLSRGDKMSPLDS